MESDAKRLLEDALKLPPEARAAVARSLLESLDEEFDQDAEEAWGCEIQRRLEELDTGAVKGVPWSEARRQILRGSEAPR